MTRGSASDRVTLPTLTFADACERYGIPRFAKIDLEGAEVSRLAAARPFLKKHHVHFAVDTNHYINGCITAPAVEDIFRSVGYQVSSREERLHDDLGIALPGNSPEKTSPPAGRLLRWFSRGR
jgi:hypothetical protein